MTAGDEEPREHYRPAFFTECEWAFVLAACDRLIPSDSTGPGAIDLGVPEFLDRHMQTPYAAGAIWYREGPFFEAGPEFGYQGSLAPRDILRAGIGAIDRFCATAFSGRRFAELDAEQQDSVLRGLELGHIELREVPSKCFFELLLAEVRTGYFADPIHGGNRDMGSWKSIGYPGMQEDYRRWIGSRDEAYPHPPISLPSRET